VRGRDAASVQGRVSGVGVGRGWAAVIAAATASGGASSASSAAVVGCSPEWVRRAMRMMAADTSGPTTSTAAGTRSSATASLLRVGGTAAGPQDPGLAEVEPAQVGLGPGGDGVGHERGGQRRVGVAGGRGGLGGASGPAVSLEAGGEGAAVAGDHLEGAVGPGLKGEEDLEEQLV